MAIPISNAKDKLLNENTGSLPDMGGALLSWFQAMTFTVIVKTVVNFQVVETPTNVDFRGVWQQLSDRKLMMKPEGQRSWSWFQVHASPGLALQPDDVVSYLGVQYRVMARIDHRLYNFIEYHITNDFTGAGPN